MASNTRCSSAGINGAFSFFIFIRSVFSLFPDSAREHNVFAALPRLPAGWLAVGRSEISGRSRWETSSCGVASPLARVNAASRFLSRPRPKGRKASALWKPRPYARIWASCPDAGGGRPCPPKESQTVGQRQHTRTPYQAFLYGLPAQNAMDTNIEEAT